MRFSISGSTFWGWHCDIDLGTVHSNDEIEQEIKRRLISWVEVTERATGQDDLYGLRREIGRLNLFFHGMTFEELLAWDDDVIYLCCDHKVSQ